MRSARRASANARLRMGTATAVTVASDALLLGAIVVAPWMITPLRSADATRLEILIAAGIIAWIATLVLEARLPRVPLALALMVVALITYGALLVINARGQYESATQTIATRPQLVSWLPGAIDRATAWRAFVPLGVALLATVALVDRAHRPRFVSWMLWVIALDGAALGVVGALARFGAVTLFHHADTHGGTPFASFGYHANAAAYLDLTLPAALALVSGELTARDRRRARLAASVAVLGAILVGCVTQASKFGLAVAVVIIAAFALVETRAGGPAPRESRYRTRLIGVAALVIVVAVGVGGGIATRHRWAQLPSEVSTHGGRAEVWRVAFDAWEEHRLGGSGPGSFKLLLPGIAATKEPQLFPDWIVTPYQPGRPVTIWMYAHDDPLQTLAEWGLIGAALWSAVLAWPLACGLRSRRDRVRGGEPLPAVTVAGLLALSALLVHSLVDFPLQIFAIELTAAAWAAILIAA